MTLNDVATLPTEGVQSIETAWVVVEKHIGSPEAIGVDRFDSLVSSLLHRALAERAST
jgi:hypothetical protein